MRQSWHTYLTNHTPAWPVWVSLHHDRQAIGGELHVWVKGIHDIPSMDADIGNEGIKNIANGLGSNRPVTQLPPVVWPHLIEGVFYRPVGFDKFGQQVVAKFFAQRNDPLSGGGRIDALV
jgi:hypothetical protein